MRSSIGDLISLYALSRDPAVFVGAGGLSTRWVRTGRPALLDPPPDPRASRIGAACIGRLRTYRPAAGGHRISFDQPGSFPAPRTTRRRGASAWKSR